MTPRVIARVAGESRVSGVKEVSVQRNDHIGGVDLVLGFDRLAESHLRSRDHIVTVDRLVHMPLGLGINSSAIRTIWSASVGDETVRVRIRMPGTLHRFLRIERPANRLYKSSPGSRVPHVHHGL